MEKVPGTEPHILSLSKDEGRRAKTSSLAGDAWQADTVSPR